MIGGIVRGLLSAAFGALREYLGDLRAEHNLKRLGWSQAELDRRGASAFARRAARKRERDVLQLDMSQIIGVNRRGAAALDPDGGDLRADARDGG